VQLPENRGLWLTYAKYLTPKGDPIHGKGIEPDVRVEEPDVEFGDRARKGRDARHGRRSSPQESRLSRSSALRPVFRPRESH
jgi:C-terminal processing protease CtpA/Prc